MKGLQTPIRQGARTLARSREALCAACVWSARRTTGRRESCCARGMPLPPRPSVSRRNGPLSLHGRSSWAYQEIAAPRARFPDSPLRRTGAPRDWGAAMPTWTAALLLPAPRLSSGHVLRHGCCCVGCGDHPGCPCPPSSPHCFPCVPCLTYPGRWIHASIILAH